MRLTAEALALRTLRRCRRCSGGVRRVVAGRLALVTSRMYGQARGAPTGYTSTCERDPLGEHAAEAYRMLWKQGEAAAPGARARRRSSGLER